MEAWAHPFYLRLYNLSKKTFTLTSEQQAEGLALCFDPYLLRRLILHAVMRFSLLSNSTWRALYEYITADTSKYLMYIHARHVAP